ncbi:hypothetical protein Y032_0044g943 [Ancylostoma ceylanicum]|uniref:FERM domain-containing protein n=2 Tax=Ancylostoma ceylanicum TaxID=53326 RepID=A0A016UDW1_9BILA|nr:hypothetical protein Y032_0044g943 [Ancylostoma ceylanicum]
MNVLPEGVFIANLKFECALTSPTSSSALSQPTFNPVDDAIQCSYKKMSCRSLRDYITAASLRASFERHLGRKFEREVQLKPHHKPYEMRRGWAEVLAKFAESEPECKKKEDEPVLYFRRNVQLSETREQQIVTFCSRALEMLLIDARSSLFLDRCPMTAERSAELAGLGFAMDDGGFDQKVHTVDWLRTHLEDQLPTRMSDVIRGPMLLGKALSGFNELESRVVESWKKGSAILKANGVDEVRRHYLTKLRESTPCYGAAFFRGLIERPGISPLNIKKVFNYLLSGAPDTEVLVGVNSEFITIIDASKHDLLLVQKIRDCTWRKLIYSSEEIRKGHQHLLFLSFPDEDYIKSRNEFITGKAEQLASMKMNILHIFSSQTMLLNAMLNSVKSAIKEEDDLVAEELSFFLAYSHMYYAPIIVLKNTCLRHPPPVC